MLRPVRPSLNFWYYLGIISSPAWVFSFLAMDFVKKRTGLIAVLLILTLVISGFVSNFVLSKLYFWLRGNPKTERFFYGYERAGKTTGYVLVFFGNIGLYYYSEKSVACILTFLFLALYCLSTLLCIQPYTDFGVLEFLLSASMNQALSLLEIRSYWSWVVIIACVGIGSMRYCLEPVHPRGEGTRDQLPTSVKPPATYGTVDDDGTRDEVEGTRDVVVQLPTSVQPPATYETVDPSLKLKLRKPVEIVPPEKEKDGGGEKNEKGGGGKKGGGQGGEILQWPHHVQYGYPDPQYGNVYVDSEMDPNSCSVM